MVAQSNLACFALFFLSTVLITHSMSEARVCRDQLCNEPISVGRVIKDFEGVKGKDSLALTKGDNVYIYAKNPGETPEMWFGQTNGKDGYFPKENIEEYIVYDSDPKFVVSKDILEDPDDVEDSDSEDTPENKPEENKDDKKLPVDDKKQEEIDGNKESNSNSGEPAKESKGTMSGIMDSLTDFFSLPVGTADESSIFSDSNNNIDNANNDKVNQQDDANTKKVTEDSQSNEGSDSSSEEKNEENIEKPSQNPPNVEESNTNSDNKADGSTDKLSETLSAIEDDSNDHAKNTEKPSHQKELSDENKDSLTSNANNLDHSKNSNSNEEKLAAPPTEIVDVSEEKASVDDGSDNQKIVTDVKEDAQNIDKRDESVNVENKVDSKETQPLDEPVQPGGANVQGFSNGIANEEVNSASQPEKHERQNLDNPVVDQTEEQLKDQQLVQDVDKVIQDNEQMSDNKEKDGPLKDLTAQHGQTEEHLKDQGLVQDGDKVIQKNEQIDDNKEKDVIADEERPDNGKVQEDKHLAEDNPVKDGNPDNKAAKKISGDAEDKTTKETSQDEGLTTHGQHHHQETTKEDTIKDGSKGDDNIEDALKLDDSSPEKSSPQQPDGQGSNKDQKLPKFVEGDAEDQTAKSFQPDVQAPADGKGQDEKVDDSKKPLEEVVQNVQESLKAVVEEDLKNHFQKADGEELQNDGAIKNDESKTEGISTKSIHQRFMFKKESILSQRRQKKEQEESEKRDNVNVTLDSNDAPSLSKEPEDGAKDTSKDVRPSEEGEEDEEEEEDDEEVPPVAKTNNNISSEEGIKQPEQQLKDDKVTPTEERTVESHKDNSEEEKHKIDDGDKVNETSHLTDDTKAGKSEYEKTPEEKEQEERLRLLKEERRRVEQLNKQATLMMEKRKALEKKMEEERKQKEEKRLKELEEQRLMDEKRKKEEELKKQKEELRKAKEEAEAKRKAEEEQQRLLEEKHQKEEALKKQQEEEEKKAREEAELKRVAEEEAAEKKRREEERRQRINLEVEKRLKAMEEMKKAEEKRKEKERKEKEQKERERILWEQEEKRIKEAEEKRKQEELKRKEEQKKDQEKADKLKEEMEIEAALKEKLASMTSPKEQQKDENKQTTKVLTDPQNQGDKVHLHDHGDRFAAKQEIPSSMPKFMHDKLKHVHMKASKRKGSIKSKDKKKKKKKKKRIDKEFSKDDDEEDEEEEEKTIPKRRLDRRNKETTTQPIDKQPTITTATTSATTTATTTATQAIKPTASSLYTTTTTSAAQNTDITPTKASTQTVDSNVAESTLGSLSLKATPLVDVSEKAVVPPPALPPTEIPAVKENQDSSKQAQTDENKQEALKSNETLVDTGVKLTPDELTHTKKQEFVDVINQQMTQNPTSIPEIPLGADHIPEPAKAKSFGIVKGFWRFHEVLAEGVLYYSQPVKGVMRGALGFVGLGQLFDDICNDLATAPPLVLVCTILVGAVGAIFLLCTCVSSINSRGEASGPSLRDILKTYEARIRILEDERDNLEKNNKEMDVKLHYALEEKHHAEDGANTARKSLENIMLKIKQFEHEHQELEAVITANKEEIKAYSEEMEKRDEEFEHLQKTLGESKQEIQDKEDTIEQLNERIAKLEESNASRDDEIKNLNDKIDSQDKEKDELNAKVQEWNDKFNQLQESLDDQALRNSQIQEQYEFKCNEVEVLQDCLLQIKGPESDEDEEEERLSEEEKEKTRADRLKAMLDASRSKTEAKIMREENVKYKSELNKIKTNNETLEEKVQNLEHELSQAKMNEDKAYLDFREKEIELTALRKYFKDTESELHRKLTAEESAREATENKLKTELSKASSDSKDLVTYKKLYKDINEEIQRVKGNVNHQVAQVEERAHNNWLKYRTVERELEEVKRERDALRRRLYAVEKEKNRPGSSQSGKSSDSTDGGRAESPMRGPPPPGPTGGRVPEHNSPVPMGPPPPPMHPMYGSPRMPMGYGPPPPPGRYGPPPPPGHHGTPPPMRNGPAPPPHGSQSPAHDRDERDRRDSRGYGPDEKRSDRRASSPARDHRNNIDSPGSFSRPPLSTSTPGHSRMTPKQNSLDSDRQPNESPPPYEPYASGPQGPPGPQPRMGSPMIRHPPPVRPPYGPMGPLPARPQYGPPMGSPMGPPHMGPPHMGPPRPPLSGHNQGPNASSPLWPSPNAYRRQPRPPPTGPS